MKGEAIARVRRQQEVAAKNRLAEIRHMEEGRMAMMRLQRTYSMRPAPQKVEFAGKTWHWWE